MRANKIQTIWNANQSVICGWMNTESPYIAEMMGVKGMDAVCLDMQHGVAHIQDVYHVMQAISATEAAPMVRVPSSDPALIMKVLDLGAYGVICPLVDTAEEAADFVNASSYPPVGGRSYGPVRGTLYGGPDYFAKANETIVRLAMIETASGLENVEAICATAGLDGIFIGPADLAISLGHLPGPEHSNDEVEEAISTCKAAAHKAGIKVGIFCSGGKGANLRRGEGYDLVVPSHDAYLLDRILKAEIALARGD